MLLTLHHFTNPMWFERLGAFARRENIPLFLRFVEKAVECFGDLVSEYITINEPNVYAYFGYYTGEWPPGVRSMSQMCRVMSNLCVCHILAYERIHTMRAEQGYEDTMVSFAAHLRVFEPRNARNPFHIMATRLSERMFQGAMSRAFLTGRFSWPLYNTGKLPEGRYADFLGLNYYTRSFMAGLSEQQTIGVPINDLGWEIYPQGLEQTAGKLYDILPLPIYVTENGTCDSDDSFRSLFIYDHLKVITESDLPFAAYYHWCFTDNFEWLEGENARFGIVHIDYETSARRIKKSGEFLSAVLKAGGVTQAIMEEYLSGQTYRISTEGRFTL